MIKPNCSFGWGACKRAVSSASPLRGATTSADADSSADLIGTIDDEEMEVKRMADVGTQPESEVRPEPEEGQAMEVVPTAIRGDALPELKGERTICCLSPRCHHQRAHSVPDERRKTAAGAV